jgi:AcrR family transcriptional regulator
MARPRTTTDEQILTAARACFLEHGASVPTTVIAARLGISHAVLFQRFGTKERLMRAALLPAGVPSWVEVVRTGPTDEDAHTQLLALAQEMFAFYERMVPNIAVLRSAGITHDDRSKPPAERAPVRARRDLAAWFQRASARGLIAPVNSDHAADLLLGALFFRPFQQHVSQSVYTREQNRAYVRFAVDAVWHAIERATSAPKRARPRANPSRRRSA